jgi:glyoxylase-like metal-dependent hydrolase (beta-lactamase superfamily II)
VLLPEPVAVAPGVYLLGKLEPAAAYAVDMTDGLVLIDSGLEDGAVTGQLVRLHLDVRRLRAILLTHAHGDHSLGAEHLRTRTGAKVYAGQGDCLPLREGRPREAFFSTFSMPGVAVHPTTVDVELKGDEKLQFGEARIVAIATPGHTPGSVCYLLEKPGLRALFTGDVVMHLNPAIPNALGTYAAYLPPLYRGNVRDYLASLRRLRALPLPDLILPGHPRTDPDPEDPHPTASRWQGLLDRGIAEMERLLARYEADGANFLDGIPRQLLPGLHYLGNFGGSAVYCLDGPAGLVLVDAPGNPALVEFLAQRFTKLGWAGRKVATVLLTSADESATGGLAVLVERTSCQVVAPKAGREEVSKLCPPGTRLLTEEGLEKSAGIEARVIPLGGRGRAPVAYAVRWAGKMVLFSGRIPVKVGDPAVVQQLLRAVAEPGGSVLDYRAALDRLAPVNPNVWLPAVPVHGQNANLYDDEWSKVLTQNRELFP